MAVTVTSSAPEIHDAASSSDLRRSGDSERVVIQVTEIAMKSPTAVRVNLGRGVVVDASNVRLTMPIENDATIG